MKSKPQIQKLFMMFHAIYLKKWIDNFNDPNFFDIAVNQWAIGLSGIDNKLIEKAVGDCRLNFAWPPSIAEFIALCDKYRGVPTEEEVMQQAIRRNFEDPVVGYVFSEVGSFAFSNDSAVVLEKKVKKAYKKCLEQHRQSRLEQNINLLEEWKP